MAGKRVWQSITEVPKRKEANNNFNLVNCRQGKFMLPSVSKKPQI